MQTSADPAGYNTPDFARIEIRMTDKAGLASAANQLRGLADALDLFASGTLSPATSNYLAWGAIKSTSKKLRGTNAA